MGAEKEHRALQSDYNTSVLSRIISSPQVVLISCHPTHPTNTDRFGQIFRDHWHIWCDLRLATEVPPGQQAYVHETVQRMMLCRGPDAGYALYI